MKLKIIRDWQFVRGYGGLAVGLKIFKYNSINENIYRYSSSILRNP